VSFWERASGTAVHHKNTPGFNPISSRRGTFSYSNRFPFNKGKTCLRWQVLPNNVWGPYSDLLALRWLFIRKEVQLLLSQKQLCSPVFAWYSGTTNVSLEFSDYLPFSFCTNLEHKCIIWDVNYVLACWGQEDFKWLSRKFYWTMYKGNQESCWILIGRKWSWQMAVAAWYILILIVYVFIYMHEFR
jgi:hypothetical protein